jgi:hypothetical protein
VQGDIKALRRYRRDMLEKKATLQKLDDESPRADTIRRQLDALRASALQTASSLDPRDLREYTRVQEFVQRLRDGTFLN